MAQRIENGASIRCWMQWCFHLLVLTVVFLGEVPILHTQNLEKVRWHIIENVWFLVCAITQIIMYITSQLPPLIRNHVIYHIQYIFPPMHLTELFTHRHGYLKLLLRRGGPGSESLGTRFWDSKWPKRTTTLANFWVGVWDSRLLGAGVAVTPIFPPKRAPQNRNRKLSDITLISH